MACSKLHFEIGNADGFTEKNTPDLAENNAK
jgi:hypothetical protein